MLERKLTRRQFLKITSKWAVGSTALGIGGVGYMNGLEPKWIDVQHLSLMLQRLPSAFAGYRIAQISDIHIGDWMSRDHLAEVVQLVNSQQADMIVITGDFVSVINDRLGDELASGLRALSARDGVLGVLGNHDHWTNAGMVEEALRAGGAININNAVHTITRDGALLNIGGVDDVWERKHQLDVVLDKLPREGAAILLAHEPDFADTSAATNRFDLQLSGHSHGGQVRLPLIGPLRLPYLGEKYHMGLYRVGGMLHYTNRGVGMIRPYVRLNCRPEITVFTLQAAN